MGTGNSTADAGAIQAFNRVRTRAGVGTKTSITRDDILKERRVEFAFEGDYWFDIQRQGYERARVIIEAQNRGTADSPAKVTFDKKYMFLPVPAAEILQDPELAKDPVSYY
jgi:hypothetical protein